MAVWYARDNRPTSTLGWSAVTAWAANTAISAGALRRQVSPTNGNERVFICVVAGTTHATTEPSWSLTAGAKTTDNTVTWQEVTGKPGVNGDVTNTAASSTVRSTNPGLGRIIKNNAATALFICTTAGTCGAGEPSYNTGAVGNTTTDSGCTWTYIGASFSNFAAPIARAQNFIDLAASGDALYVASDNDETISTVNMGPGAGTANKYYFYSVDPAGGLPATVVTRGAIIRGSGASGLGINSAFFWADFYFEGFDLIAGSGSNNGGLNINPNQGIVKFNNCLLKLDTTSTLSRIGLGNGATPVEMVNTKVQFGSTSQAITTTFDGRGLVWRDTASAIQGSVPTTLFGLAAGRGTVEIRGVDLSAAGSGKTIVGAASNFFGKFYISDCKIDAAVTLAATATVRVTPPVDVVRTSGSGVTYGQKRLDIFGVLDHETTIVRTGGATDGTTSLAWKIVTTANPTLQFPFESFAIPIWNTVAGSPITVTLYGIWGGGAVPNNDDIWIDVEYLGASGSPLVSTATSGKSSPLAANAAYASDTSTWGGSTTKFRMAVTFTPQLAGYLYVIVRVAKVSTTVYIDPQPVLS